MNNSRRTRLLLTLTGLALCVGQVGADTGFALTSLTSVTAPSTAVQVSTHAPVEPVQASLAANVVALVVLSVVLLFLVHGTREVSVENVKSAIPISELEQRSGRSDQQREESAESHTTGDGDDSEQLDDAALLTNEEQIIAVLEANGNRLHQSEIVEITGWSKSKVSRVLSQMDDDDDISKISLGKENLITLPGEEPEGTKTPENFRDRS